MCVRLDCDSNEAPARNQTAKPIHPFSAAVVRRESLAIGGLFSLVK